MSVCEGLTSTIYQRKLERVRNNISVLGAFWILVANLMAQLTTLTTLTVHFPSFVLPMTVICPLKTHLLNGSAVNAPCNQQLTLTSDLSNTTCSQISSSLSEQEPTCQSSNTNNRHQRASQPSSPVSPTTTLPPSSWLVSVSALLLLPLSLLL
jgi:hypothetical protein